MSDSETKGRCYNDMKVSRDLPTDHLVMADAIDRLAADVASIKEKVDAVSPEDVAHLVESEKAFAELFAEQRDAAIRERDQWREEARLAVINRDEARADVERLKESRDAANRLYGAAQAEAERLRGELAAPQPASPAPGWLTDEERELLALLKHTADGCSMVDIPWRPNWPYARMSRVVNALLSRAGSPPVVEVPVISRRDVPMQNEALAYRAAMDKAGVPWKEVGRE